MGNTKKQPDTLTPSTEAIETEPSAAAAIWGITRMIVSGIWEQYRTLIVLIVAFGLLFLYLAYLGKGLSVMLALGAISYLSAFVSFDWLIRFNRSSFWSLSAEYIWILCGLFGALLALSDYDIRLKKSLIQLNQKSYQEQVVLADNIIHEIQKDYSMTGPNDVSLRNASIAHQHSLKTKKEFKKLKNATAVSGVEKLEPARGITSIEIQEKTASLASLFNEALAKKQIIAELSQKLSSHMLSWQDTRFWGWILIAVACGLRTAKATENIRKETEGLD